MVGNQAESMRWIGASKYDVTLMLVVELVSSLSECFDCLAARNHRQLHPPATSSAGNLDHLFENARKERITKLAGALHAETFYQGYRFHARGESGPCRSSRSRGAVLLYPAKVGRKSQTAQDSSDFVEFLASHSASCCSEIEPAATPSIQTTTSACSASNVHPLARRKT